MNRAEVRRRQAGELSNILAIVTLLVMGRRIGNNGIAYMTVAMGICALAWTAVGGSLSDTLGRLLRGRRNKGQYRNVEKMRKNAMILQTALGLAGSLLACLFAQGIAEGVFGMPYSAFIIRALSPVIFFRAVSAALQGGFQGEGAEFPTMAAGILRVLFMLGFGFLFTGILGSYGEKAGSLLRQENFAAMYGGVGVAAAISAAELLVVIFLFAIDKIGRDRGKKSTQEGMYATDSSFDCVRYLCRGRWMQAAAAFLACLPLALGPMFFCRRTEDENVMAGEYGVYAGGYLALGLGAACLIGMLVLPVTARVFSSLRKGEHRIARSTFLSGMHICLVHGIFASVFAAAMGEELGELLCPQAVQTFLPLVRGGSSAIAFGALACYFARYLQTAGKKTMVLMAAGMADGLYVMIVMITGRAGILSLVYGAVTAAFVACLALGVFACGHMRVKPNWAELLAVPGAAGAAAGLACVLFEKLAGPHMNVWVTLFLAYLAAGAVYWAALLLLRNFKEQELEVIPGGRILGALKQMLHVP